MDGVKLFFVLRGWRLDQGHRVTIPRSNDVFDLKLLIISACGDALRGVPVDQIRLYGVSIASDDELDRLDLTDHPPLLPKTTIGHLFPEIPGEDYYIIVVNGMVLRRGLICVFSQFIVHELTLFFLQLFSASPNFSSSAHLLLATTTDRELPEPRTLLMPARQSLSFHGMASGTA